MADIILTTYEDATGRLNIGKMEVEISYPKTVSLLRDLIMCQGGKRFPNSNRRSMPFNQANAAALIKFLIEQERREEENRRRRVIAGLIATGQDNPAE